MAGFDCFQLISVFKFACNCSDTSKKNEHPIKRSYHGA